MLVVDINFRAVPAVDEAGSLDALARGRTDHINYILAGREFSADWYLVTFSNSRLLFAHCWPAT